MKKKLQYNAPEMESIIINFRGMLLTSIVGNSVEGATRIGGSWEDDVE